MILIVGVADGLGGRLIRTPSFFGPGFSSGSESSSNPRLVFGPRGGRGGGTAGCGLGSGCGSSSFIICSRLQRTSIEFLPRRIVVYKFAHQFYAAFKQVTQYRPLIWRANSYVGVFLPFKHGRGDFIPLLYKMKHGLPWMVSIRKADVVGRCVPADHPPSYSSRRNC